MKHRLKYLTLFVVCALGFASCGVDIDFDENAVRAESLTLDRDTIYLRVGESIDLSPIFTPDSVTNQAVLWTSDADSVATTVSNSIVAVSPGSALITATSVSYRLEASCHIVVLEDWPLFDAGQFPYETVIYAKVTVGGSPLPAGAELAAFVDYECRGTGVRRVRLDQEYWEIRVGSDIRYSNPEYPSLSEEIEFRYYDPESHTMQVFPQTILHDGETHGYPSHPFELSIK